MNKILIATKNKDKFEIVKKILGSIIKENLEYYSLYDLKDVIKDEKEVGDIEQRAYNKAKQIYDSIDKNKFMYVVGIDDGIEMKGEMIENVKEYIKDIIEDRYLQEGEIVSIVRAYCFMDIHGNYRMVTTKIPFEYKKVNKKIEITENSYPLSNVLKLLDSDKTVVEMDKDENNKYYLKYSQKPIEDIINDWRF